MRDVPRKQMHNTGNPAIRPGCNLEEYEHIYSRGGQILGHKKDGRPRCNRSLDTRLAIMPPEGINSMDRLKPGVPVVVKKVSGPHSPERRPGRDTLRPPIASFA